MKTRIVFTLSICLLLAAACTPAPAAAPTAAAPTAAVDSWQTYSNPAGFSIRYPATWSKDEVPQQAGETIQTVSLKGSEGGVDLHWGVGFGGACPQGYTTVKVAEGELPACYSKNADGTEVWNQIGKQLEATSFSADAHTNNTDAASHDLVLKVLSTLSFPPPAPAVVPAPGVPDNWQTYSNPVGFSIRYPAAWTKEEIPQKAGDTYQTVSLKGTEGGVDLHWGVGFGGACPQGYTNIKVADGELPACYTKNADGTELWAQINKELAATSFSAEARTNNAQQASHDLVLQVVSTLSFSK